MIVVVFSIALPIVILMYGIIIYWSVKKVDSTKIVISEIKYKKEKLGRRIKKLLIVQIFLLILLPFLAIILKTKSFSEEVNFKLMIFAGILVAYFLVLFVNFMFYTKNKIFLKKIEQE